MPEIFQYKVDAYTNEDYAVSIDSAKNVRGWHVKTAGFCGKLVLYTWIFVLYYYRNKWIVNLPKFEKVFKFALFLGGISLVASNIPSGFRYFNIAKLLFYACIIMALSQQSFVMKTKVIGKLTVLPLLFHEIFIIRTGFEFMSFQTLILNPIIALFWETNAPLIDFVKGLF